MNEDNLNQEERARRMSREEAREYRGLTLNENGQEDWKEEARAKRSGSGFHFHVFTPSKLPWWKKAIYLGIAAAFLAAFLMVAWFFLLGGLVIAGAVTVVYLIKKYILK